MSQFFLSLDTTPGTDVTSFIPDSGTSPVVPTASGQITLTGNNGLTVIGGTNTLTLDMQSPFTGDFTFTESTAGNEEALTVQHTSDTAGSHASLNAVVAGSNDADPFVRFAVTGGQQFSLGIDNSFTDAIRFTNGATPSNGSTYFQMTSDGELNYPFQPSFLAILNTTATNVTGAGTTYTIAYNVEFFDQGNNFSSNTFTASISGNYYLTGACMVTDPGGVQDSAMQIVTSNRTYSGEQKNPQNAKTNNNELGYLLSILADMDAADTATVTIRLSGAMSDAVDVFGNGTDIRTYFCGALVN